MNTLYVSGAVQLLSRSKGEALPRKEEESRKGRGGKGQNRTDHPRWDGSGYGEAFIWMPSVCKYYMQLLSRSKGEALPRKEEESRKGRGGKGQNRTDRPRWDGCGYGEAFIWMPSVCKYYMCFATTGLQVCRRIHGQCVAKDAAVILT